LKRLCDNVSNILDHDLVNQPESHMAKLAGVVNDDLTLIRLSGQL